MLKEFY